MTGARGGRNADTVGGSNWQGCISQTSTNGMYIAARQFALFRTDARDTKILKTEMERGNDVKEP